MKEVQEFWSAMLLAVQNVQMIIGDKGTFYFKTMYEIYKVK